MTDYRHWIARRVEQRRREYPAPAARNLFSIVTPVYNTPPAYLRALAASVFAQDYPAFEWVIIDNGCTAPATRAVLAALARDPRVRLSRLEPNRGIMGGTRAAVEQARGRYVLPVDSDDLLYPDALRVMAQALHAAGYPAAAYSDEDKVAGADTPCHPFFKPDWDPVLFLNCCYIAHLCAIDRAAAAAVGAYTDEAAHGCHDWDTFCRLVRAGHTPLHVPEILYSWRMHSGSTAAPDAGAKPYTIACQRHVLSRHLGLLGFADRFEVRTNTLFGEVGLWHPARRHVDPPPLHVLVLTAGRRERWRRVLHALAEGSFPALAVHLVGPWTDDDAGDLRRWAAAPGGSGLRLTWDAGFGLHCPAVQRWLAALPAERLVAVLDDELLPLTADWPWEAAGLFELHAGVAVVGGRVFDRTGRIVSAGEVFGMDGLLGCPDRDRRDGERGHYGLFICQRCVDAVAGGFFVTRAGFLRTVLAERAAPLGRSMISAWLAAAARRRGLRIVYTPHIAAQLQSAEPLVPSSAQERLDYMRRHGELLRDGCTYSRFMARDSRCGYSLAPLD